MESELTALVESLRTGGNRLNADLQLLEGNFDDVRSAVQPRPRFEPESEAPAPAARPMPSALAPAAAAEPVAEPEFEDESDVEEFEELATEAPVADDEAEGARLVAFNMALNGTAREETDRYLAENYNLADRAALIAEVYTAVEG
jgi:hypothetical protein